MKAQEFETYRKENKFSQGLMAEKIGISFTAYYKFVAKNSKPHLKTWRKLEKFYNENIEKKEISIAEYFKDLEATPVKVERRPKTHQVYLESVEELLGELLDGNEVHVESSTGHTLKIVNGFIVRYSNDNPISINAPILCSERYYAIKPIPLNLEIGKRYIAKNGSIVTVFNSDGHRFIGVADGKEGFLEYYPNGANYLNHNEYDLVEEK